MLDTIGVICAIFIALCLLVVVLERMKKAETEGVNKPFKNLTKGRKERS